MPAADVDSQIDLLASRLNPAEPFVLAAEAAFAGLAPQAIGPGAFSAPSPPCGIDSIVRRDQASAAPRQAHHANDALNRLASIGIACVRAD